MTSVRAINLAIKFGLEVVAVAAFAYWGTTIGGVATAIVLGIAAPLVAIVLWARFAAPRSEQRLPLHLRVPFELTVFGLATLALLTASTAAAIAFIAVVIANSLLLTVWHQWEE